MNGGLDIIYQTKAMGIEVNATIVCDECFETIEAEPVELAEENTYRISDEISGLVDWEIGWGICLCPNCKIEEGD